VYNYLKGTISNINEKLSTADFWRRLNNMKGLVAEEMFYFTIIIISIGVLVTFFIYQQGTRGIEVRKSVEERGFLESANSAVLSIFNFKLPFVEKVALETAIDSILQGKFMKRDLDKSFYGVAVGTVNSTEIIKNIFDNYISGRWKLEISTPDGTFTYGYNVKQDNIIYSFMLPIPVPHERVGYLTLSIS
jgi:hypothetical protein